MRELRGVTVAVVGLGYVGLPLVVEFGRHLRTIGYDISEEKVRKCQAGVDPSREITDEDMRRARETLNNSARILRV